MGTVASLAVLPTALARPSGVEGAYLWSMTGTPFPAGWCDRAAAVLGLRSVRRVVPGCCSSRRRARASGPRSPPRSCSRSRPRARWSPHPRRRRAGRLGLAPARGADPRRRELGDSRRTMQAQLDSIRCARRQLQPGSPYRAAALVCCRRRAPVGSPRPLTKPDLFAQTVDGCARARCLAVRQDRPRGRTRWPCTPAKARPIGSRFAVVRGYGILARGRIPPPTSQRRRARLHSRPEDARLRRPKQLGGQDLTIFARAARAVATDTPPPLPRSGHRLPAPRRDSPASVLPGISAGAQRIQAGGRRSRRLVRFLPPEHRWSRAAGLQQRVLREARPSPRCAGAFAARERSRRRSRRRCSPEAALWLRWRRARTSRAGRLRLAAAQPVRDLPVVRSRRWRPARSSAPSRQPRAALPHRRQASRADRVAGPLSRRRRTHGSACVSWAGKPVAYSWEAGIQPEQLAPGEAARRRAGQDAGAAFSSIRQAPEKVRGLPEARTDRRRLRGASGGEPGAGPLAPVRLMATAVLRQGVDAEISVPRSGKP